MHGNKQEQCASDDDDDDADKVRCGDELDLQ